MVGLHFTRSLLLQGNHEYINGGVIEWTDELRARGVFVLENDCVTIPGLVDVVGVNDLQAARFDEDAAPDPPKVCRAERGKENI